MLPGKCWVRYSLLVAMLLPLIWGTRLVRAGQAAVAKDESQWQGYRQTVQPFLAKHCFECHTDKNSGDVRLDGIKDESSLTAHAVVLEKALAMLRKRAMPPKKRPQPADVEIKPVVAWLEMYAARLDQLAARQAGRRMTRRLNRAEYNNTVRDLLGVDFRPADDFPADVPGHGFDTVAGALTISPALAEKYLVAAEKVAHTALFGVEPMKPERTYHQPFFTADAFSKNKSVKLDYDETGMSLPSALHVVQRFPADGEYTLRAIMRGVRPPGSNPIELGFWIDGVMMHQASLPVPTKLQSGRAPGEINGLWAEFRTPIKAGEHWLSVTVLRMYEGLPPAYQGPKPANTTLGVSRATDAFFPMYLNVVGPFEQVIGPSRKSLEKVFGTRSAPTSRDSASPRRIVSELARRAFRRTVSAQEIDDLVKWIARAQTDGDSFEEGLCLAIERMLVSPHFLFRVEKDSGGDHGASISSFELASRLSYFLWSSMPDDELLTCAEAQTLAKPDVLEAQVRRMLADSKAQALVENFGGQWLQTRALESHTPDRIKFPEFTDYTRMSMQKESELFFDHILRQDRPILDFLDANYTFLNQRLAEFYQIPGVEGHEFRKVDLTGTHRGGVLAQASVLAVSSYANRTSPVLRGKCVLENLLNDPPPPPPPEVPALDEKPLGQTASMRMQLEEHRKNPNCASCHARLDPLGFALEHFDAIGRWREQDGKVPIDSSGTLPDGRSFKSFEEMRACLKAKPDAFTECLAEKMLTYALGRGLERADRDAVKRIARKVAQDGYRFSRLVLEIVRSQPFLMQNVRAETP